MGILQARILEWIALPSSKGSSWPRGQTAYLTSPATLSGGFFTTSATWCIYIYGYGCCSVAKSSLILCDPMNCPMPVFPVLRYLPEFAETCIHWVSDAIRPSHSLSPPSPLALNISQHQGVFHGVSSLHQLAKGLELQHQSFQWIFRVDFL